MADDLRDIDHLFGGIHALNFNNLRVITAGSRTSRRINGVNVCLVKGTLVTMEDGTEIPIERIKPKDKIKTYDLKNKKNSSEKVIWVQEPRNVEGYFRLEAEDGTVIEITGEHPMFVFTNDKNGKFIEVNKVKVGQKFLNKENKLVEIKKKKYIKKKETVYNITVDKYHNFFGAGMLCHNIY